MVAVLQTRNQEPNNLVLLLGLALGLLSGAACGSAQPRRQVGPVARSDEERLCAVVARGEVDRSAPAVPLPEAFFARAFQATEEALFVGHGEVRYRPTGPAAPITSGYAGPRRVGVLGTDPDSGRIRVVAGAPRGGARLAVYVEERSLAVVARGRTFLAATAGRSSGSRAGATPGTWIPAGTPVRIVGVDAGRVRVTYDQETVAGRLRGTGFASGEAFGLTFVSGALSAPPAIGAKERRSLHAAAEWLDAPRGRVFARTTARLCKPVAVLENEGELVLARAEIGAGAEVIGWLPAQGALWSPPRRGPLARHGFDECAAVIEGELVRPDASRGATVPSGIRLYDRPDGAVVGFVERDYSSAREAYRAENGWSCLELATTVGAAPVWFRQR